MRTAMAAPDEGPRIKASGELTSIYLVTVEALKYLDEPSSSA